MQFGTLVHATALALALFPAVAAARVADDEPLPIPIPARVEIGVGGGLVGAYTEVGVQLPLAPRAATAFVWHPGNGR